MLSTPALQCLFCNHLNPAGASFCNDCGSQMHMQPCDRCGAINKRSARICHKCGAGFTLPAAPAAETRPAAAIDESPPDHSARSDVAIATEHALPPASMVPPADETHWSEMGPAASPRPRWRVAALALLVAAMGLAGYYYSEQSAELPKTQSVMPTAPRVSDAPMAATPVTNPNRTTSKPADPADPALTVRAAPPTEGAVMNRQEPPIFKECPAAVAALGLCSPSTKQENQ